MRLKDVQEPNEIRIGTADAGDIRGYHHVNIACADGLQQFFHAGTLEMAARVTFIMENKASLPAVTVVCGNKLFTVRPLDPKFIFRMVRRSGARVDRAADKRNGMAAVRHGGDGLKRFHGSIEGRLPVEAPRQSGMLAVAVHGEAAMDFAPLGAGGPEAGSRWGIHLSR